MKVIFTLRARINNKKPQQSLFFLLYYNYFDHVTRDGNRVKVAFKVFYYDQKEVLTEWDIYSADVYSQVDSSKIIRRNRVDLIFFTQTKHRKLREGRKSSS